MRTRQIAELKSKLAQSYILQQYNIAHCNNARLQQCNIATMPHCNIATMKQCKIATKQHYKIAKLQQSNNSKLQQYTLQYQNNAIPQQCKIATLYITYINIEHCKNATLQQDTFQYCNIVTLQHSTIKRTLNIATILKEGEGVITIQCYPTCFYTRLPPS